MKYRMACRIVSIFLFLCCHGPALAAGPGETVPMLQKGIDAADLAMVETYLDIDAVAGKAAAVVMADENALREAGKEPAAAVLLSLGAATGANEAIRDMLAAEAKEYLRHGVVSGAFAGKPKPDAPLYRGLFVKAFRGGAKDKRTFGPARVTAQKGDTAHIATSMSDAKGRSQPLNLVLQKQGDVWRVIEVANLAEIISENMRRKKQ